MEETRVAVVTGANRGMGLEACRQLASEHGMRVVLTSRDEAKGRAAVEGLKGDGVEVDYHKLDVTEADSVAALAAYVEERYGRCDVVVNNAGAFFEPSEPSDPASASIFVVEPEAMQKSFDLNTLGAVRMCQALIPLMRKNGYGRVVNVSTGMAQLEEMHGSWPGYRMAKTALNAVTRIVAEETKDDPIKVNSVCPGYVRTGMGGPDAPRSVEEGVDTTIWLATLREDGPSGGFFRDCKRIPW